MPACCREPNVVVVDSTEVVVVFVPVMLVAELDWSDQRKEVLQALLDCTEIV